MQNQPQFELLETMLWEPKKGYFLLDTHVQRLLDSAEYFGFDVSRSAVCDYLQRLTANLDQPHRIRLLVDVDGTISSQTIPLDRAPVQQPWRVALATEPIQSDSPFLYHKTTHRQLYETARASRLGYDDVLLWNERGELTEASIANVVVQFGVDLVTPPVHCGLLAGTYRAALLAQNTIQERVITVDDLKRCDRLFLINSVRKWVEARLA